MNFKTLCILAFAFTNTLLAMDTTPEYEILKEVLRTEGADHADAFVEACGSGYEDLVKDALNRPESKRYREDGLIQACEFGRLDVVKLLLQDENFEPSAQTASSSLNNAVVDGHRGLVEYLIADPRFRSNVSIEDLMKRAIAHHHTDVLQLLIGQATEKQVESAINAASMREDIVSFKTLLSSSKARIPEEFYSNLFSEACKTNDLGLVQSLLAIEEKSPESLNYSAPCRLERTEIVELLLQDPRVDMPIKEYELKITAELGQLELMKKFVNSTKLSPEVNFGEVLLRAVQNRQYEIFQYLLSLPCDKVTDDNIRAAFIRIAGMKSIRMTRLLLADPRFDQKNLNNAAVAEYAELIQQATQGFELDDQSIGILDIILGTLSDVEEQVVQAIDRQVLDDNTASSCFTSACAHGHTNVAKFMVEEGLINPLEFIDSQRISKNPTGVKTLVSILDLDSFSPANLGKVLVQLVYLGAVDILRPILDKYKKTLSPKKLEGLLNMAKDYNSYCIYRTILDCDPSLGDPKAMINLIPFIETMIYVEAGEIEKLPKWISMADLDILIFQAKKSSMMHFHLLALQINHIKKYHRFSVDGESCSHAFGSKHCKEYIEAVFWPIIDSLVPRLRKMNAIRTSGLEVIIAALMFLVLGGTDETQAGLVIDRLGIEKID